MTERKLLKNSRKKTFLKGLFAVLLVVFGFFGALTTPNTAFADPVNNETTTQQTEKKAEEAKKAEEEEKKKAEEEKKKAEEEKKSEEEKKKDNEENCYSALGEIGWLVCPGTGKIASAVDWLYKKIESVLQINPVKMEDGAPIYEIWKYCRAVTNIIFVIFLLVVIYSQITGVGISNYGLKKALPKLIIAAILVNLSFLICSLAVDVSNIIGNSLRGVFTAVEQSAVSSMSISAEMKYKAVEVQQALAGGTTLLLGAGMIGFETGAIWMLIPVVLGAIVAVVTGLVTIALRQAVVMILIMVSPLAMVAYILPNTEQLFEKWKKLLTRMLVFYPLFSLLFGASSLAGFAIITGAKDGFGVLLGVAVQIFPLFFSWSLMKMSGTILGTINEKLRSIASKPVAASQNWANSRKELSRQKHLASNNVYTPSRYLTQYLSNRKIARETETAELAEVTKDRGMAYAASLKYRRGKNGKIDWSKLSKDGERAYEMQARRMTYSQVVMRDKNNFNQGFGVDFKKIEENGKEKFLLDETGHKIPATEYDNRVSKLNVKNMDAADLLFAEQARGERIDFDNAKGRYDRIEAAMNAKQDSEYKDVKGSKYTSHFKHGTAAGDAEYNDAIARYRRLEGISTDIDYLHYFGASAAASYSTQIKIVGDKYQKYFEMLPPTQDVFYRLDSLTKNANSSKLIDAAVAGLRVLNQRGDTDLVRKQMENLMADGKLELGTHASQALASFLMFEVKDSDPTLRRFGKYLNLETAAVFNEDVADEKRRKNKRSVDLNEYVRGEYYEDVYDEDGNVIKNVRGKTKPSKKNMAKLLEGTSFDNVERTAFKNYDDMIKKAYGIVENKDGKIESSKQAVKEYLDGKKKIDEAIGPAFISASLKYLSGSEQLENAVKFKTGIEKAEIRDANGNIVKNAEYAWDKFTDKDAKKQVKEFYQESTQEYLSKQTPNQILGLRSDYKGALEEQLFDMYYYEDNEKFRSPSMDLDERKKLIDIYNSNQKNFEAVQKEYVAISKDENVSKEVKDAAEAKLQKSYDKFKKARTEIVGAQFRDVVGANTMAQIYESRQSGAANNAKAWVREWSGLDDPELMKARIDLLKEKTKNAPGSANQNNGANTNSKAEVYNAKWQNFLANKKLGPTSTYEELKDGLSEFVDSLGDEEFKERFKLLCKNTSVGNTLYAWFENALLQHFGK